MLLLASPVAVAGADDAREPVPPGERMDDAREPVPPGGERMDDAREPVPPGGERMDDAREPVPGGERMDDDDIPKVEVEVGKTVSVDVGMLRGIHCDNLDIIKVDLVTKDETHNHFVVTGVEAGSTLCRIGTQLGTPYRVYDVHVLAPKPHR